MLPPAAGAGDFAELFKTDISFHETTQDPADLLDAFKTWRLNDEFSNTFTLNKDKEEQAKAPGPQTKNR